MLMRVYKLVVIPAWSLMLLLLLGFGGYEKSGMKLFLVTNNTKISRAGLCCKVM